MLCQNCRGNEATTHIKRIVNGDMAEMHLCSSCASQLGYDHMFSGFGFDLSDFFGGFLSDGVPNVTSLATVKRCKKCGSSFNDIVKDGKVGCADCYEAFYEDLLPILQRIHGRIQHSGKTSLNSTNVQKAESKQDKIGRLKKEMNEAVERQDFEQAANIRDEIKALESEGKK
ncbi:MAG TPA: UvrB/UvrC motif-containing protein [Clostridia bacterium]|nr:UvrB/UvrC motif-containing protein [Clostridia bacterium]